MKISVSITWNLLSEFDDVIEEHGFQRSEAIRRGMRMVIKDSGKARGTRPWLKKR